MLNNKSLLITGGTGSFGQMFVKTVIREFPKIKRLVIFSRDELKQFDMATKFPNNKYKFLRYYLGDVRDKSRLRRALEDIDYVVHAAALKQVVAAETNPNEFIQTNVIGAQNLIDACLDQKVKKVIALSSDKAAAPINLYGATKLCSDKLFIAANNYVGKRNLSFSVMRYGNVLGSRGSVLHVFTKRLKENKNFEITDKRMTRFNLRLSQAVGTALWSLKNSVGGEIFVPKIPSFKITDLATAISKENKKIFTGIKMGEKLHEEMITSSDSFNTYDIGKFYAILSSQDKNYLQKYKKQFKIFKKVKDDFCYNSKTNKTFLSINQIKSEILKYND